MTADRQRWSIEQILAANIVSAALLAILILALNMCGGCARRAGSSTNLPEVRLVVEFREPVSCYVPDPPSAPDHPPFLTSQDESDVISRTMVHRRSYDDGEVC